VGVEVSEEKTTFAQNATAEWHSRPVSTVAAVVTMVAVGASIAVQWGIVSHRLDTIEREVEGARNLVTTQINVNADQEARIRVVESRIGSIEATVLRSESKLERLLELQGERP
jgi:hypothetical protein